MQNKTMFYFASFFVSKRNIKIVNSNIIEKNVGIIIKCTLA
jgi:hypothetical protein